MQPPLTPTHAASALPARPGVAPLHAADDVAVAARALGIQHTHRVEDGGARDAVDGADGGA